MTQSLCNKQCGRPIDLTNKFKTCCRPCAVQKRLDMVHHDAVCDVRYHAYQKNKHNGNNEQKSNDSSKWRCVLCNWINKPQLNHCEMCHKERPNKKRKWNGDVCPDSIASPFHVCTQKCVYLWGITIDINEPPNKKQKTDDKQTWKCSLCTFINSNISLQCKMCAAQKDNEEESILKRLRSEHHVLQQNKSDNELNDVNNNASSMKEEMDYQSDNDVALDMFKNGLTPDIVKRKTKQNNCDNNNKQNDLLFALQMSEYLEQSGFTCIANDVEDRYIADIVAQTALDNDDYWNAHNMANTIPWMDGGDDLDNLIDGFDHGNISSKRIYNKTEKTSKFIGYDENGVLRQTSDDEIDEDSVKRVNICREFQYAMSTGKIVRCRLIRRRKFDDSDDGDHQFRICESQFMRSCNRGGVTSNGMQRTLKEVVYVINPQLINKFQSKKKEMKRRLGGSGVNTILAWHGTPSTNVDSIVESNFSLSHLSKNSGDRGYFGAGIYFSEFANVSQGYGDALLLCKIMLGKSYKISNVKVGCDQKKGYDSHMAGGGKYGTEIVIFDMNQILPCYIVKY